MQDGGMVTFTTQVAALLQQGASDLEKRQADALHLASNLRRSGPGGEAKALLEAAANLFQEAQRAKVECEFGLVAACEGIQELIRRLWGCGEKGEIQALAAVGLMARLKRLCKVALERMDGGEGQFPGSPSQEFYPSPFLSAQPDPFAA